LASRPKGSKAGPARGEPSPRGKRPSGSQAEQTDPPKRGKRTKVAPEPLPPQLAAALPHPDEAAILASEVSTTALTAATQAAVATVEDPAPKPSRPRLVAVPDPQTASPSSASPRPAAPPPPRPQMQAPSTSRPAGAHDLPGLGGAEGVLQHAAARSAAIATLGLLDLNTRVLDLMRQQSEVSLSAIGAVLSARSVGDAMQAQTDGLARTLDLHSTQWNEIAKSFRRVVEEAAEPVRAASLWPGS